MMNYGLLLLLVSLPLAYQRVICDEEGKWACPNDWNCCENPKGGYGCCYQPKACASDGHCYLLNPFTHKIERAKQVPAVKKFPGYAIFIHNFLKTIGVYDALPETCECRNKLELLVPDVIEVIKKIKEIKSVEELILILMETYPKLVPKIQSTIAECKDVPAEIKEKVGELIVIVSAPEFAPKIIKNIRTNFKEIMKSSFELIQLIKVKEYANAGKTLAAVFEYIFA